MKPNFFDIHSHLDDPKYELDSNEVISRMKEGSVWTTTIGTDEKTSQEAVTIAERNDGVFACVGIHPRDDMSAQFDEKTFETLVGHPKTVAVGECGLDYFKLVGETVDEKKRQKKLFEEQIIFAVKHNKPLMIHCRDAYEDATAILESFSQEFGERLRGNAHFFAGGLDIGQRLLSIGFSLSFTGVITFARDYDEVIRFAPRDKILSETDAPYVAPVPFRGTRNEPSYVSFVADTLSLIRGEDKELFRKQLVDNALELFSIDCK